jgi:hypothetical protein
MEMDKKIIGSQEKIAAKFLLNTYPHSSVQKNKITP